MSEGSYCNWSTSLGGMTISEAKRLTTPEDKTVKFKKLLAEQMLDPAANKGLISKKLTPAVKRYAVAHLRNLFGLSGTACVPESRMFKTIVLLGGQMVGIGDATALLCNPERKRKKWLVSSINVSQTLDSSAPVLPCQPV